MVNRENFVMFVLGNTVMKNKGIIHKFSENLFWDINIETIDMEKNAPYVVQRVEPVPMLHYETITPETLSLLERLSALPILKNARLVGGTALALQLGHRTSVDLDFFGTIDADTDDFCLCTVRNTMTALCS